VQVVIFVGGRGTRMGGRERPTPKALHELGGRPILWHVMELYKAAGHRDLVLTLGYQGAEIVRYFGERPLYLDDDVLVQIDGEERKVSYLSGRPGSLNIKLVHTGLETGKGERLRRVSDCLEGDTFFATYGDGLADIDLRALLEFHRSHGKVATLTAVRARSQFGHVTLGEGGAIVQMDEKPALPGWINGGFFVFERRIFDYLQAGDELEPDCFPRLVADGQLVAFTHEGFWACMDTDKDYAALEALCRSGTPPWRRQGTGDRG
jgi:glucose-1-phosphate cytidylyltransferase